MGRIQWARIKIGIPLVGSIFERIALGRFAKTFAIMGRSGVLSFGRCLSSRKWWATSTSDLKSSRWGVGQQRVFVPHGSKKQHLPSFGATNDCGG